MFTNGLVLRNVVTLYRHNERGITMKLTNNEPKNSAINIRCNDAEKAMVEAVRCSIRPRVSASRMLLFLCEEKARKDGIIADNDDGTWTIEV